MARKWIVGLLLILHAFLHLLGFLTSWDLIEWQGISRTPTILQDDLPTGVIRDIGALWLLGLLAFAVAGVGTIQNYLWWRNVAFGSAVISLIVTVFWIHEAWPGTLLNAVIITLIARSWYHADVRREQATSASD